MFFPNLRHLYAATEIGRLGSISAASERVHLSQSAVTQGLAKLEQSLGEKLFSRSATGTFPTLAGKTFLLRAERALESLQSMERGMACRQVDDRQPLHRVLTATQLRALVAIADTGSFSQAATHLGLAHPSLQRAARELEAVCEQALFRRRGQGIELTWEARTMARYANLALAELRQGLQELQELRGRMQGTIAIGSLPLAMPHLVPHAVTRLLQEFPEARVKIVDGPYEEQLHALLNAQLDLIVGALRFPEPSGDISQERLFDDPLFIVLRVGHELLLRQSVSAGELAEINWIAPRQGTPARAAFTSFFRNEGLNPPEHVIECSSLVAIRGLLMGSDRAALLPARQVELEVKFGQLSVMPRPLSGTSRAIGLTLRKEWKPTLMQARFLEIIRDQ